MPQDPKTIEWALTAPAIDVGANCENIPVPKTKLTKAWDEEYQEVYEFGYRQALGEAREFFAKKQHPLLQCIECKNTESTAGAMARVFNQGRCVHCGGYFKVVKA